MIKQTMAHYFLRDTPINTGIFIGLDTNIHGISTHTLTGATQSVRTARDFLSSVYENYSFYYKTTFIYPHLILTPATAFSFWFSLTTSPTTMNVLSRVKATVC